MIRKRISLLREKLDRIGSQREIQRRGRDEFTRAALVGYTNAGKSTLMNMLTRAGVFVEDKLFATLDPTTRALRLPNGDKVMIVDTVGFINKIPHSLIEAFKSTLEEVCRADLLLHLVDVANPLYEDQIRVIEEVLQEIGAGEIPTLLVPNKVDLAPGLPLRQLKGTNVLEVCPISALSGTGITPLLETVGKILDREKQEFRASFSPGQGDLLALLRERGRIIEEIYQGNLIHVTAMVTPKLAGQMRKLFESSALRAEEMS